LKSVKFVRPEIGGLGVWSGKAEWSEMQDDGELGVWAIGESDEEREDETAEAERMQRPRDGIGVKGMLDPRLPSETEVRQHQLNHLPYRNWCSICVRGKGRDMDHRKDTRGERGLSEYALDYCFPGDEFGYKLTVLVGRERVQEW